MINTTSESLKARKVCFQHFSFYKQLKYHVQLRGAGKKLNNIGARTTVLYLSVYLGRGHGRFPTFFKKNSPYFRRGIFLYRQRKEKKIKI